jgi:hypothetical protein
MATRRARRRRISGVAPSVNPKKMSADPGGLTTGKIAAITNRNVLRPGMTRFRYDSTLHFILVGLANVLSQSGRRYGPIVCVAANAATKMGPSSGSRMFAIA